MVFFISFNARVHLNSLWDLVSCKILNRFCLFFPKELSNSPNCLANNPFTVHHLPMFPLHLSYFMTKNKQTTQTTQTMLLLWGKKTSSLALWIVTACGVPGTAPRSPHIAALSPSQQPYAGSMFLPSFPRFTDEGMKLRGATPGGGLIQQADMRLHVPLTRVQTAPARSKLPIPNSQEGHLAQTLMV